MKRFTDDNGDVFVIVNSKTYYLSLKGSSIEDLTKDAKWASKCQLMGDGYYRYFPTLKEF